MMKRQNRSPEDHEPIVSPRQLAAAIGVSESSVKRWVDDGTIPAGRTAGGHRRIAWAEALRYVRESGATVVRPELLGLDDAARARHRAGSGIDAGAAADALFELLHAGERAGAAGLLLALYLDGAAVAEIVDAALRPAMARLGELWLTGEEGIFREHRATEIALQAMARLRLACAPPDDGPVTAVGGAPAGDPYLLATLSASIVLAAEGLPAVNLGADTPLASLETAAERLGAGLVWLSVSSAARPAELSREVRRLTARLAERGVPLVVGGAQSDRLDLPRDPHLYRGGSMAELAALVRGLRLGTATK